MTTVKKKQSKNRIWKKYMTDTFGGTVANKSLGEDSTTPEHFKDLNRAVINKRHHINK